MAEQKTLPTKVSVEQFLKTVEKKKKRNDCLKLTDMMQKITKEKPIMWGPAIVGFGSYKYKYSSGHEGVSCIAGFSPRKAAIALYIVPGFKNYQEHLKKLGKHKTSGSCLHIKKLSDVDETVLKEMIREGYKDKKEAIKKVQV